MEQLGLKSYLKSLHASEILFGKSMADNINLQGENQGKEVQNQTFFMVWRNKKHENNFGYA